MPSLPLKLVAMEMSLEQVQNPGYWELPYVYQSWKFGEVHPVDSEKLQPEVKTLFFYK